MRCRIVLRVPLIAILATACAGEGGVRTISPTELEQRMREESAPLVLDVRTPEEFQVGHVPGAVNLPHTELASRLEELRTEQGVVLYCMVGPRARLGEQVLLEAGVSNLFHLEGGFAAWQQSGLPVATHPPDRPRH